MSSTAHSDSAASTPTRRSTFELDSPINLRETLFAARWGPRDPCLRLSAGEAWRGTLTPLGPATERLVVGPDGHVTVEAWGPGADWLIARAPALCGAHDQPRSFTPDHSLLRRLVHEHRGLRIGRTEAVFETAMGVVLEQRVASPDAWQSWRGMVYMLGQRAPGPHPGLWVPPSPERIIRTPYEVFHRFGVERRRADIIRRLATVSRRLEETVDFTLANAYDRFSLIHGLGPWSRGRIGLVALGDPDAVIVGDLHLPDLIAWALAGERRGSDERMLELLEPYRGHRGRVVRLLMAGRMFKR